MELPPKEKAKELVMKFQNIVTSWDCYNDEPLELEYMMGDMKKCALICLDEVVNSGFGSRLIQFEYPNKNSTKLLSPIKYWEEVKQELEKL
mgnify:FL=1